MVKFFQSIGNFFSGIFNFFGTTGNFISFLLNNIWWLIGGALVAFVVILVISLILHTFPNWIITTLVCIFCIGGALGLAAIFQKPTPTPDDTPSETVKTSDTIIISPTESVKIVANGGYNSSYINAKENDPHCPTSEDKVFDINLIEYNDRAIFYYDIKIGQDKYYTANMIFNKTSNGLVPVGSFNVHAIDRDAKKSYVFVNEFDAGNTFMNLNNSVHRYNGGTIYNGWLFVHDPQTFMPSYYDISYVPYDKAILRPTPDGSIWFNNHYKDNIHVNQGVRNLLHNAMQDGIFKIYQDNFQQLDKLGIKCSSDIGSSADMNAFYNALYNSVKANGCSSVIDVTDLVADVQYGIVYKSNRFMNINYTYRNTNIYASDEVPNKDKVNDYLDANKPTKIINPSSNPMLKMSLINTDGANLTTFSISTHPVTVKLTNTETNHNYMFIFDNIDKLNKGISRAVPFGTYDLTITSNVLDFGGTKAKFTTTKDHPNIELRYQYKGDSVNSKITLSPVRNIDLTNFNIEDKPVTIVLVNKETQQSYEIKFDTVEKFQKGIVENLKLGNYTYSIVSSGLSFEFTTGDFAISSSSYDCTFYYDYLVGLDLALEESSNTPNISTSGIYIVNYKSFMESYGISESELNDWNIKATFIGNDGLDTTLNYPYNISINNDGCCILNFNNITSCPSISKMQLQILNKKSNLKFTTNFLSFEFDYISGISDNEDFKIGYWFKSVELSTSNINL